MVASLLGEEALVGAEAAPVDRGDSEEEGAAVLEALASEEVSVAEVRTLDGVIAVKMVVVFFLGLRVDVGSSEVDDEVGVGDGSLEVSF